MPCIFFQMLYRCFGRPCTCARSPCAAQVVGQALAKRLDALLALDAASRRAGARRACSARGSRKRNARSSSSHLICQMPSRLASGANTCMRLARQRARARRACSRRSSAGSAGATPAAAARRAGRARTRAASCARARSAARAARLLLRRACASRAARWICTSLRVCATRLAYDVAERLADHLLGLVQVVARVDEVGRRAHRRRRADALQDRRHAIGMRQRVLAGVEQLAGEQRLGEGARARELRGFGGGARSVAGVGDVLVDQLDDRRRASRAAPAAGLHGEQQELPHGGDLSGCDQRRRMADAGELDAAAPSGRAASSPARSRASAGPIARRAAAASGSGSRRSCATASPRRRRPCSGVSARNGTAMAGS